MRRIRVLVCSVDEDAPDEMTELASFEFPAPNVTALQPETALDDLETTTHEIGTTILRRVFQAQWDVLDARLTELHRQHFPAEQVTTDGQEPVIVASRFGTLELQRRVCYHADSQALSRLLAASSSISIKVKCIASQITQEYYCWNCGCYK